MMLWGLTWSDPEDMMKPPGLELKVPPPVVAPEERVLAVLFGPEFAAYQEKVRRWI
jgi:hypothetical protein